MEMRIEIVQDSDSTFKARNTKDAEQIIDGKAQDGFRPMESLLNALASCAALDLVHILKKQRQEYTGLKIEVLGTRPDEGNSKPFKEIVLHFKLEGNLDKNKVERAVELSVEKYCSVGASLAADINIRYKTTFTN